MYPRSVILFGSSTLAVVSAVNPACSSGLASIIAGQVAGIPEAQSYCSKNYPLAPSTVTATGAPVTTTVTTLSTTVTITGAATTTTTTFTSTATATETDTVTGTAPYPTKKKREWTAPLACRDAPAQCTPGSAVINGRKCTTQCNIDRPGGDYAQQHTGSFAACVQACAADSRCVTAQYHEDNGYCYLKNVRNSPVSGSGEDTVDCDPAATTTTTTKPPSTTTTTTKPPSTTTTTTKPPSTTTTTTKPPSTTTTTTKPPSTTTTTTTTPVNPWSSVLSKESSIIGQICTCVETPVTSTVSTTATIPVTATSTATNTVTPTSTASTTVTTTVTTTTTTTVTPTSTATCGPTVPARNQGECGSDEYCCDSSCSNTCTSPAYICYQACSPDQCANDTPGNPQTISYYGDGTCYATTQCSCPASRARRALEMGSTVQRRSNDANLVWRIHPTS